MVGIIYTIFFIIVVFAMMKIGLLNSHISSILSIRNSKHSESSSGLLSYSMQKINGVLKSFHGTALLGLISRKK